jgi:hypothetical protein
MSVQLNKLRSDRDETVAAYNALEAEAGDTPTTEQQEQLDALFARAEEIDAAIKPLAERHEKLAAGAAVLAKMSTRADGRMAYAVPTSGPQAGKLGPGWGKHDHVDTSKPTTTAGEFFSAIYRAEKGDTEAAQFLARAVADQKTGDVPGLLPKEIVGNLIDLQDNRRPTFLSFTSQPMPAAGATFSRPQITQHVQVAEQTGGQKTELASRKMTVALTDVSKRTFGGVLDLAQQAIDWTDPALLQIVFSDFIKQYARTTEGAAVTALTTAASATGAWNASSTGAFVSTIAAAIDDITIEEDPDTLWLSRDQTLALVGTTNEYSGASAITVLRQALAEAGMPLRIVTARQLPSGTRILGCSALIESYETLNGFVQAPNVPMLGWDIGYSGYLAFFAIPSGFISLES